MTYRIRWKVPGHEAHLGSEEAERRMEGNFRTRCSSEQGEPKSCGQKSRIWNAQDTTGSPTSRSEWCEPRRAAEAKDLRISHFVRSPGMFASTTTALVLLRIRSTPTIRSTTSVSLLSTGRRNGQHVPLRQTSTTPGDQITSCARSSRHDSVRRRSFCHPVGQCCLPDPY